MSHDEQAADDANRWYFGGTAPDGYRDDALSDEPIGYEAAHPALQSLHWPDAAWPKASEPR